MAIPTQMHVHRNTNTDAHTSRRITHPAATYITIRTTLAPSPFRGRHRRHDIASITRGGVFAHVCHPQVANDARKRLPAIASERNLRQAFAHREASRHPQCIDISCCEAAIDVAARLKERGDGVGDVRVRSSTRLQPQSLWTDKRGARTHEADSKN